MKTHVILKFDYEDNIKKDTLISKVVFPQVIRDVKFIEILDFSPSAVLFAFTCDLITDSFSNCIDNLLSISLGGVGARNRWKAKVSGNVREMTIRMRYPTLKEIYSSRQKWARAHLVIHSSNPTNPPRWIGGTGLSEKYISAMKTTTFLLKLETDESQTRQSIDYQLSKPLHNARCIQVINWFASGGYDYVTCPQIKSQVSNDTDLKDPILAYGVGGVSKNTEVMEFDRVETLNRLQISLQKPYNAKYSLNFSFVHLIVFHD